MPAVTVETPVAYQVFQRDGANRAAIAISGLAPAAVRRIEAQLRRTSRASETVTDWCVVQDDPTDGRYQGKIDAPAGGWYALHLRALDSEGKVLAEASVDKVGVGEIFICAGQSNAANAGEVRTRSADDRVASFDGSTWRHCQDPLRPANGEGGSPWPLLGDLLARQLDMPVAFFSVAVGGTSVKFWQPGEEGYAGLKRAALALGENGARAVLWHQGESDTSTGASSEEYRSLLANTITQIRKEARYDIPWFVANVSFRPDQWDSDPQSRDAIRAAQQALWEQGTAYRGPDTDQLRDPKYRSADRIHFSELGLRAHAERWFALTWCQLFEQTGQ